MGKRWEHFHHQADIGIRGIGKTPDEAFQQAALALTAVLTNPQAIKTDEPVEIRCENPDRENLLVDWLNAIIYEMATRNMLFSRFDLKLEGAALRATAWGDRVNPTRHHPAVEVKAATHHELVVRRTRQGDWIAQCVVDV